MVVHDLADIFLESAKLFNYVATKNDKYKSFAKPLCDTLFVIFAIVSSNFLFTIFFVSKFFISYLYLCVISGVLYHPIGHLPLLGT